jgi:hypothetical protein
MGRVVLPSALILFLLIALPAGSTRLARSEEPVFDPASLPAELRADTTDIVDEVPSTMIPIAVGAQTLNVPYYSNRPLDGTYADITRAILVCHGTLRNANDYYAAILEAGRSSGGADAHTLIIAPQFLTAPDLDRHHLPEDILYWAYMGWRKGDNSLSSNDHPRPGTISSFAVADTILMRFVDRLPALQKIVVCGHSAGGQFTNLYTAGNRVHQVITAEHGIPIQYIVSNPSCYIYFDAKRWVEGTSYVFQVPSAEQIAACPDYDDYKYGLNNLNPYMNIGPDVLRDQYSSRNVVYLLGGNDTDPNSYYLDKTCPAMLEGSQRLERGIVYYNHLIDHFGSVITATQTVSIVPGVGHDEYGMFTSQCGKFHIYDYGTCTGNPPASTWEDVSTSTLRNITVHGVAWGDYDRDGDPDLFLPIYDGSDKLFRNDASVLTDATTAPLNDAGQGMSAAWGDVNNDGYSDLYLVNWRGENHLFRNGGGSQFTDVTAPPLDATGDLCDAAWADFDLDGDIDLFITRTNGQTNSLFRNDGTSGFTDVTASPLLNPGDNRGAVWGDYDNDGDPDLYVCASSSNKLFRNDGGGFFVNVTSGPLSDPHGGGSAAAWGDYDNDGDLDLYLVNRGQANLLLRNDGGGVFTDVTAAPININAQGRSVAWADYDNDGLLDLYVGNFQSRNKLFRNLGGGAFSDATTDQIGLVGDTYAVGWADHDRDGDLDLFVATRAGSPKLLRNNYGLGNHWLQLDLEGTASNRSAIGARVRILASGVLQYRVVGGDAGYESQNSPCVEFGLGGAVVVDEIQIRWPSGIVQTAGPVSANQRLIVHESSAPSDAEDVSPRAIRVSAAPNPFLASTTIHLDASAGGISSATIFDPAGRRVRELAIGAGLSRPTDALIWDGRDDRGRACAPGIYLCRVGTLVGDGTVRLVRLR